MERLSLVDPSTATGKQKDLLDGVKKKLGTVPNLMRGFATSPAVLEGYLNFSGALGGGSLPTTVREQIALAVGQQNDCDYCLAAHSAIGKSVGLGPDEIADARRGTAEDAKTAVAIDFAREIVDQRGWIGDAEVEAVRAAGWSDGEIAEIIANVALNIFTNYFNHIVDTPVDFPKAEPLPAKA